MTLRGPRTLLGLILSSLAFVTLPLLVAIGYAAFRLGQLTTDSTGVLTSSAISTIQNQRLDNLLINMERNSRQYLLLGAARSLEIYREDEAELRSSLIELSSLPQSTDVHDKLQFLASSVDAVDSVLATETTDAAEEELIEAFRAMDVAAESIDSVMREATNEQLAAVQAE
jgi:CHASE3 domain sensor protein